MTSRFPPLVLAVASALGLAPATSAAAARSSPPRPRVEITPRRVLPGDAFLVRVRTTQPAPPAANVAGRPLSFFPVAGGFVAVGALPVETAAGPLPIAVVAGEVELAGELEVAPAAFRHRALTVQRRYVEPPDPAVQARIDEDRAAFAVAFAQPPVPPLFAKRFALPRRDRVTAGFGDQRTLNGVKPSQHYGMDLAGKVGAPVVAANAGEVVLVRDCWASGQSIILWHGAGLYTTYFHLSRALVRPGDRVARGQRIGAVGRSGRVSGPHLHWGVRVGDLYVDPASLLRLPVALR
jgi:murein DD-endopeptidase MepM/ murein hydrolase activator NlpD